MDWSAPAICRVRSDPGRAAAAGSTARRRAAARRCVTEGAERNRCWMRLARGAGDPDVFPAWGKEPQVTDGGPAPRGRAPILPRNVWVVTLTSFLTDVSSEMLSSLLPLFLANVLGARTAAIGLIEGVAGTTARLPKKAPGWASGGLGR